MAGFTTTDISFPASKKECSSSDRPIKIGKTMHSIQCLRFLAATAVVLFHSYVTLMTAPEHAFGNAKNMYWFGFGKVGVHIFFVISGYIMYLTSFARPSRFAIGQFLMRRIMRIYPIYWIFVFSYLAVAAVVGVSPELSRQHFWEMLALVPGSASLVIGPAWTLSYEVYFYMVFGMVMWLGARRGTVALSAVFVASIAVGVIARPASATAMLATNALLLEFLMGVWIARLTLTYAFPRTVGLLALVGAAAGYALGLACGYDRLPSAITWGTPSALLVAGAVIVEQCSNRFRNLARQLSWLGDGSYSLYLCHILIVTLVVAALRSTGIALPLPLLLVALTSGCVWFAVIFHALVERPLTGILHRMFVARSRREGLVIQPNG